MKALLVDSTRERLVVILVVGSSKYERVVDVQSKKHMPLLIPTINSLLNKFDFKVSDMDCFSAIVGPGSFTGIRVGVATINAFATSLKKPVVVVNSLELLSYNVETPSLLLISAGHGNYYGAKCDKKYHSLYDYGYYTEEDIENFDGEKIYQRKDFDYINEFVKLVKSKAIVDETAYTLRPMYLRKSQAEREKDNEIKKSK